MMQEERYPDERLLRLPVFADLTRLREVASCIQFLCARRGN